jgi:hypothetical protein
MIFTSAAAQNVTVGAAFDARTPPDLGAKLAFSDADHLYAIGNSRAILYVNGALIRLESSFITGTELFVDRGFARV